MKRHQHRTPPTEHDFVHLGALAGMSFATAVVSTCMKNGGDVKAALESLVALAENSSFADFCAAMATEDLRLRREWPSPKRYEDRFVVEGKVPAGRRPS